MRTAVAILFLVVGWARAAVVIDSPYSGQTNFALTALHLHTSVSVPPDPSGNRTLAEVCRWFGNTNGFHAYSITEHDRFSTNSIPPYASGVFITGQEVTRSNHTLGLFLTGLVPGGYPTPNTGTPQGVINDIRAQGGIAALCHPNLNPYPWADAFALAVTNYQYIEVNNTLAFDNYGETSAIAEDLWDVVLLAGRRVFGYCAIDMHIAYLTNGMNRIYVADPTSSAQIKDAMERGDLTFARDHAIRMSVSGGTITADTLGVSSRFEWIVNGATNKTTTDATSDSYTPTGSETYVRVKAIKTGTTNAVAYSQPFWISVRPRIVRANRVNVGQIIAP